MYGLGRQVEDDGSLFSLLPLSKLNPFPVRQRPNRHLPALPSRLDTRCQPSDAPSHHARSSLDPLNSSPIARTLPLPLLRARLLPPPGHLPVLSAVRLPRSLCPRSLSPLFPPLLTFDLCL
jgi:hypothetical protein